ncbi:MAG: alanine racemase [Gemmatimonas sp.]
MQITHAPSWRTLSIAQLTEIVGGTPGAGLAHDGIVTVGPGRVTIHSNRVESGSIFFALRGKRDGHQWVSDALAHGALLAVLRRDSREFASADAVIGVDDPLRAMQQLAAWYRRQLSCDVIAVAGSLGKTTTKEALLSFLSESEFSYGSPGSYNSQIGVALSILGCPADAHRAVIEVAATAPGEFATLAEMLRPTTVVITMIGSRFQSAFGSVGAYVDELMSLTHYQRENGLVVSGSIDVNIAHKVPTARTLLSPHSANWPIVSETATGGGRTAITFRTPDGIARQMDVATSSTWLSSDVAIALATCVALGKTPSVQAYSPTSLDLQTWKSPLGAHLLRSAAVDDAIAWRIAIGDAFAVGASGSHVYFVLSDAVHALSRDTLLTLQEADSRGNCTILVTGGAGADALQRARIATPVHVFASAAALGQWVAGAVTSGDVVAVFAGRSQLIEGVSKELFNAMAPARLRVDIGAIEHNLVAIRRQCPGARVMAVVKAGAYGVDAPEIARHLASLNVDELAVSDTDEGVAIRRSGNSLPILVLHPTPDEFEKAFQAHLTTCVHSEELLRAVIANPQKVVAVHVEVETGMNRTGLPVSAVVDALQQLQRAGVRVDGLFTHMAAADEPSMDDFTLAQLRRFDEVIAAVSAAGLPMPLRHALASSGIIRFPQYKLDMVRAGVALLGIAPSPHCTAVPLVPALTLLSRMIERRTLHAGDRVGYGGRFLAERTMDVGVVQMGYYDGIHRSFAARGQVFIEGQPCRLTGIISMDSLVVDLSTSPEARVGSDVLFFGTNGESSQPIETVAEAMGTIPYEVITGLGPRIQRIFVRH